MKGCVWRHPSRWGGLLLWLLLLLWRLAKKHRSTEVICLVALTLYLFMENKPFLLSANPFLLMLPVVFFNAETGKAQSES